jgi:hypothetical protein
MEHRHEGVLHSHELDDTLFDETLNHLFHLSVECECGYRGEIDTFGATGAWWRWFLHVHVHAGHPFTLRGQQVSIEMEITPP